MRWDMVEIKLLRRKNLVLERIEIRAFAALRARRAGKSAPGLAHFYGTMFDKICSGC